jgi:hypothetical protein
MDSIFSRLEGYVEDTPFIICTSTPTQYTRDINNIEISNLSFDFSHGGEENVNTVVLENNCPLACYIKGQRENPPTPSPPFLFHSKLCYS